MMDVKLVLMTSLKHSSFLFREKIDLERGREKGHDGNAENVVYFTLRRSW